MELWRTPNEPWHPTTGTYALAKDWALAMLGSGQGRSCLVIGSPLAEAQALYERNWNVTYLDWRLPPLRFYDMPICIEDVCAMSWPDASVDAISSTCVLCHVGMGRYGDPVREDAPFTMLKECARVLKPGGHLVMMVGPVAAHPCTLPQHRVTSVGEMEALCAQAGLTWGASMVTKPDPAGERYLCVECLK